MRKALITGITGQDGWYLAKHLIGMGYEVFGLARRSSRGIAVPDGVEIIPGDIIDPLSANRAVSISMPSEIYHLAALTHVGESFKNPSITMQVNAVGTINMLEAARLHGCSFYNAATSELFGSSAPPQNESTQFHPRSPYGVAKLAAYWATINYRESYGMFACNGILFNHESPRRGDDFVTQKIANAVAAIRSGRQEALTLGNLDAMRDWGHAKDYVKAMHMMLLVPKPDDYVVATGEMHSVREFCELAFRVAGLGEYQQYVKTDPRFIRPAEVNALCGDSSKIRKMGWKPEYTFEMLVAEMVEEAIQREEVLCATAN